MSAEPTDARPTDARPTDARSNTRSNAGTWLRAVRRARALSQRELAAMAHVPLSTVIAVESGRRDPGVALFDRVLAATGHRLVVVDGETGTVLFDDVSRDAQRDRGGRRLPAHLERDSEPAVSERTYHHRPREARGPLREHPWFGQFRSRAGCFGPTREPCANCVDNCRFGGDPEPG